MYIIIGILVTISAIIIMFFMKRIGCWDKDYIALKHMVKHMDRNSILTMLIILGNEIENEE